MPKNKFQSQFSTSKIIFFIFFIEEYQFRSTFFVIDFFWWHHVLIMLFTKIMLIFSHLPITPILKIHKFPLVCWFLGKNISNFVAPAWKLNNPCYHIVECAGWYSLTLLQCWIIEEFCNSVLQLLYIFEFPGKQNWKLLLPHLPHKN